MENISELNPHHYSTNPNIDKNLGILFMRLLEFQAALGKEIHITSGLRDEALQQKLIAEGKTNATHSYHLAGAAADIADPDGSIAEYIKENLVLMAKIGFWMEDFAHTKGWVHVQILGPKSGKRVFIP